MKPPRTGRDLVKGDKLAWVAFAIVAVIPWLPFLRLSVMNNLISGAQYAVVGVSLVVLTGWVGQISLGHAALVGVGAYVTGFMVGHFNMTFPVVMLIGAASGALIAAVLGTVALRVRGLYLAVATLIFSWMADEFLFRQRWLTQHSTIEVRALGREGFFPYLDWASPNKRAYYYAAWATVFLVIYICANLRDSKTGRAFFAVRGSETAAASLGIDVVRTKLTAFAISGAIAGAAGGLMMVGQQTVQPDQFGLSVSLFYLSIVVVGGLSSMGGTVVAALIFAALNELFFRVESLAGYLEVVSAALLVLVLLLYRGGLAAFWETVIRSLGPFGLRIRSNLAFTQRWLSKVFSSFDLIRHSVNSALTRIAEKAVRKPSGGPAKRGSRVPSRRLSLLLPKRHIQPEPPLDVESVLDAALVVSSQNGAGSLLGRRLVEEKPVSLTDIRSLNLPQPVLPESRESQRPLIEARGITVQFGGLTAVKSASLTVREGEIAGLIGPNGAGKTTLFNAIAGLNRPTEGRILLYGNDVTSLAVHERAIVGVGRTFQAIQLFGQLSVFDNLLVATHMHNTSRILSHVFVGPSTLREETKGRRRVNRILSLLELEEHAASRPADLPFGVLRMVEVARALVTGCRVIMLDEPASGLGNVETDRLIEILKLVRDLGVTLLLIEHDVRMVMAVTNYVYALEYGSIIAEGPPESIQRDQRVIASYLGEPAEAEAAGV